MFAQSFATRSEGARDLLQSCAAGATHEAPFGASASTGFEGFCGVLEGCFAGY